MRTNRRYLNNIYLFLILDFLLQFDKEIKTRVNYIRKDTASMSRNSCNKLPVNIFICRL